MMSKTDPKKGRALRVVGMSAMAVGLLLMSTVHPVTARSKDWRDGVAGLFMGMSIALNFGSLLILKRGRSCASL
jgi:hypothetical protein